MTLATKTKPEYLGNPYDKLMRKDGKEAPRDGMAGAQGGKGTEEKARTAADLEVRLSFTDKAFLVPRRISLFLSRTAIALRGREADADECDALGFGYLIVGDSQRAAEYFTKSDDLRALFPRESGLHPGATAKFGTGEEKKR